MKPATTPQPELQTQPSVPVQQPPLPQKSNKSRLFVFAILILIGVSSYFGYQNWQLKQQLSQIQSTPTPLSSSSPVIASTTDPMMNWKTYTSTDGKYEIRHPEDWIFSKFDQNIYRDHTIFNNGTEKVFGEIIIVTPESMRGNRWANISLENFMNPKSDFWMTGENVGGGPGTSYDIPSKIKLAGYNAMFQSTHPSTSGYEGSSINQITNSYFIPIGNLTEELLSVSFTYDKDLKGVDQILKTFDQILSTFKFTNQTQGDISIWKTYTSTSRGFSFKYPSNYNVEERVDGFFVITSPSERVPQAGISIEARLQNPYDTYSNTQAYISSTFTLNKKSTEANWEIYDVTGKEGMLTNIRFKLAITKYNTGTMEVETINNQSNEYTTIFDQLLSSFTFAN